MWIVYALLSAFFAALVSILAKIGIAGVNSNLATAIRTCVILVIAWGIVFATGKHLELADITRKSWLFLVLSGCATGLSWLFYFRALQMGEVAKVVSIDKFSLAISIVMAAVVLGETLTLKTVLGGLLITAGTLVLVLL